MKFMNLERGHMTSVVDLSPRQRQILQLVANGKVTKEIASVLSISTKTVEYHVSSIKKRLGAQTLTEAAYRLGCESQRIKVTAYPDEWRTPITGTLGYLLDENLVNSMFAAYLQSEYDDDPSRR